MFVLPLQTKVKSVHAPVVFTNTANAENHVTRQGDANVRVHREGKAAVAHHVTGRERGTDRAGAERAELQSAGTVPGLGLAGGETAASPLFSQVPTRQ